MEKQVTRRDFLKLAGLLPLGIATPKLVDSLEELPQQSQKAQNVIIVIFDALSARNMSLYG